MRPWPASLPERDGPGRPPGRPPGLLGRGRRINIYLPAGLTERVRSEAARRGQSLSGAIVDALIAWLRDH